MMMPTSDHWYSLGRDCPLPNTHRRLEHAHRLWHQALSEYDDLDAFLTNLNAALEALRTVTFMLQSEKSKIPDFEEWYAEWQTKARLDAVMKWVAEARTEVVHRADLELLSTARATIYNNLTHLSVERDVSPMIPTILLCETLDATLPSPFAENRKFLVLAVERRWRVEALGERELLDALAHAYTVLRILVLEAHRRAGKECPPEDEPPAANGSLACMRTTVLSRTIRMALKDRSRIAYQGGTIKATPEGARKALARYGPLPPVPLDPASMTPAQMALLLVPQAKRVLEVDGYHIRLFHLVTTEGIRLLHGEAEDRPTKYTLMRHVAEEVRRFGATAIIEVGEAWMAPLDQLGPDMQPEHAPGRREVLVVTVASADGTCIQHTTPFARIGERDIAFEETVTSTQGWPEYLHPLAEVWGIASKPPAGGKGPGRSA